MLMMRSKARVGAMISIFSVSPLAHLRSFQYIPEMIWPVFTRACLRLVVSQDIMNTSLKKDIEKKEERCLSKICAFSTFVDPQYFES